MITCSRCHKTKDESEFSKFRNGYQAYCKQCNAEYYLETKGLVSDTDIDELGKQQSLIHQLYNKIRRGAKLFEQVIDLSHDDVRDVLTAYNYQCPICGSTRGMDVFVEYPSRYGIVPVCNTHLVALRNLPMTDKHTASLRELVREDKVGVWVYHKNKRWMRFTTRADAREAVVRRLQKELPASLLPEVVYTERYGRLDKYRDYIISSSEDEQLCL